MAALLRNTMHLWLLLACAMLPSSTFAQCPTNVCRCESENNEITINCRNLGLTAIPTFSNTGILYKEITFSSADETGCPRCNAISSLSARAFANLRVKKIDLTKNAIATVDVNAFQGLESDLKELLLEGSNQGEPPYDALGRLSGLTALSLFNYRQSVISSTNIFGTFTSLEQLTLEKFQTLTTIESEAFTNKLPNLKELKLRSIPFQELPAGALLKLTSLEKLEIADTDIRAVLGASFSLFNNLLELHITRNARLISIDEYAFEGARTTVELLELSHNALTSTSMASLSRLTWPNLSQLNLGYNPLGSIPGGTFSNMPSLSYLNLNYIDLGSVDSSLLQGLSNLRVLDLSDNRISIIPDSLFSPCPKLNDLRLGLQQISGLLTVPASAFTGMAQSINFLSVANQNLASTALWGTLSTLTGLIHLDLTATGLTSIPDYAFANNGNLQILTLAENSLVILEQKMFFGLRQLLTVDLRDTNIQTINKCVFANYSNLNNLYLSSNSLTCDCDLLWLYDWIKQKEIPFFPQFVGATCGSPRSAPLTSLNRNELCPSPTEVTCPNLYTTSSSPRSTTSTTTTSTTPSPTTFPVPGYTFSYTAQDSPYSVFLFWTINDRTHVSQLILEQIVNGELTPFLISTDEHSKTIRDLEPDTAYTWCLYLVIAGERRNTKSPCTLYQTPASSIPTTSTQGPGGPAEPLTDTQLIVGLSVGGAVLIILVIAILYILKKKKKPKRVPVDSPGIAYEPKKVDPDEGASGFSQPRHFTKGGKGGAAQLDEINVKVISNGQGVDKDRLSAGSYQFLNETGKDGHKHPMPSSSKGHYENSVEERSLPKLPYGQKPISTISGGKGYVNDGFHGSSNPLPQSPNSYSEVKY